METFTIHTAGGLPGSGDGLAVDPLSTLVPSAVSGRMGSEGQRAIPRIAKDPIALAEIEKAVRALPTTHTLLLGDA